MALDFLMNEHPEFIRKLFTKEKVAQLLKKIERLLIGKINEKKSAALYLEMIGRFSKEHKVEIDALVERYPKASLYKEEKKIWDR